MGLKMYAVDVGFGYVKALKQSPFPSVVVKTSYSSFFEKYDSVEVKEPFLICFGEEKVFALGQTAYSLTRNPTTMMDGYERWSTEEYEALLIGGIVKQMPKGDVSEEIVLVTGLPYLQSQSEDEVNGLMEHYTGNYEVVTIENGQLVQKKLKIVDVHVLSQPRGAYYSLLALTGKKIKGELALIADLGFKSLDYLVTTDGQETDDSNGEDSIGGMERTYTDIIRGLRSKGLPAIKPHEFDYWYDKGKLAKYNTDIEKGFNQAGKIIVADMKEKLGGFWDRVNAFGSIYFVGGSSQRLQQSLLKAIPTQNVFFSENSQQLIVEGFGAYGRAIMKKHYGGAL
ncbi:ParM family protein [Bacillus phage YungSlug]|nr:ParM family protein [Bacillus phage YungSlug]